MSFSEMLKAKKVFLKISESNQRKGIETYCDEDALRNFDPLYKNQIISAISGAIEILIGEPIVISRAGDMDEHEKEDSRNSKTRTTMAKNI